MGNGQEPVLEAVQIQDTGDATGDPDHSQQDERQPKQKGSYAVTRFNRPTSGSLEGL